MEGISNISDIIRAKERELQKIQDMRFVQLEKTIEDRDELLLESSRRFEQLKDDFQYNLRLLEARDREITRLEGIIEKQGREREDLDQQVRNLLARMETMQQKEKERSEKFEQEKALSKRILSETKAVIESMQWSAEEDLRMKNSEISSLKRDIQMLNRAKDEAIEVQRRDLTSAFEQIIQQREEQINQREGELAHQIAQLDQRFERLSTDNLSVKANVRDLKATHERDVEEICRLEELNRQLNYQLEDTIRSKEQLEDTLKRQVAGLQTDMNKLQDQRARERQELEVQVEKFKNESIRERDFRTVLEKRLEDVQENAASEAFTLNEELLQQQRRIHGLEQEIDDVKSEKEQTIVKLGNKRIEAETISAKNRMLSEELESATDRNRRMEQNYQALESTMTQLQKEFDHYKTLMDRELTLSKDSAKDEISELKRSNNDQMQRMRQNHEDEIHKLRTLYEDKLQDKQKEVEELRELQGEKYISGTKEKDAEITQLKIQVQVKDKTLQDERTEAEALRLRLKALEAQLLSSTQELRQLRSASIRNGGKPTIATNFPHSNGHNGPGTNDLSLPEIPTFDMTSPMLSEDFNVSNLQYPDSPMLIPSRYGRGRTQAAGIASADDDFDIHRYGFSPAPKNENGYNLPPPPPPPPAMNENSKKVENEAIDTVKAENEVLKKVVKEMRQDIESLRTMQEQQLAQSPTRIASNVKGVNDKADDESSNKVSGSPQQVDELLREKEVEIERLRKERKKLMDTGNELRSALLKAQARDLEETHESLENIREENLGTVYQWIRNQDGDFAPQDRSRSRSRRRDDYFSHLRDDNTRPQQRYKQELVHPYYDHASADDEVSSLDGNKNYAERKMNNNFFSGAGDEFVYDTQDTDTGSHSRGTNNNKPVTAIRRRQEDPMAVIGNAVPARGAPRSGIYPATRTLSAPTEANRAGISMMDTAANRQTFVVHKVTPGGYLENSSQANKTSGGVRSANIPPRSNSNRTTPGQTQALERLKQNQVKQRQSDLKAEEDLRIAKSRVTNYADLKNREHST